MWISENNSFMTSIQTTLTPFMDDVKNNCLVLGGTCIVCESKDNAILQYRNAYYTGGLRRISTHL